MSKSLDNRERLIDEVRRCPVLYDTRHESHRDIDARDRCWAEIAARLGGTSEVLKREWKILRDSLRQSLRKRPGGGARRWRLQGRMAFLLPYMTHRNLRESKLERDIKVDMDGESEQEGDAQAAAEGAGAAGAAGERAGAMLGLPELDDGESSCDSLELFFASVCASARRLPPPQRRALKRRVLDALLDAETADDTHIHQ